MSSVELKENILNRKILKILDDRLIGGGAIQCYSEKNFLLDAYRCMDM